MISNSPRPDGLRCSMTPNASGRRKYTPIGIKSLAGHLQPELVQTGERRQVRGREGSVRHVEVFQMAGVGTSILGRPRPLPTDRRADRPYTLIREEPD